LVDSNPARSETALGDHVRKTIATFRALLAAPLVAVLDAFAARRSLDFEAAPLANFTRTAQPVVHLPVWTARSIRAGGASLPEGALESAVDAAVFGYLCAQVQDDGLEERLGSAAAWTLLGHALFARHHAALVLAAGVNPEFWARYSERWLNYAGAMAAFAGSGPEPGTERTTAALRSAPLALPAAALLVSAGRPALLAPLEELVRNSTDAAQLFDDLLDASEDLRHGRSTYVVRAMGGEQGADTLRRRLYLEGGFDTVLNEALAALKKATDAAAALGMAHAKAGFEADAERLLAERGRYLEVLEMTIFPDASRRTER
jgi:hypothetical protein